MFRTMADVREANREAGHHFFDRKTMQFFASRVESVLYAGRYFVTSEAQPMGNNRGPRKGTVREVNQLGHVSTVGKFMEYASLVDARERARELARESKAQPAT
jgi:hypothetical protein